MQENPCPMDRFRRRSRHAAMWPVEHAGLVPNNLAHQLQSPEGGTRAEGLNSRNGLQPQAQPRQPCGSSLGLLWRAITCTKRMRSECLNKAITRLSHVVRLHSSNIWLSSQSYPIATPILACKPARQQIFQTTSPPTIPLGRRSEAASLLRSHNSVPATAASGRSGHDTPRSKSQCSGAVARKLFTDSWSVSKGPGYRAKSGELRKVGNCWKGVQALEGGLIANRINRLLDS